MWELNSGSIRFRGFHGSADRRWQFGKSGLLLGRCAVEGRLDRLLGAGSEIDDRCFGKLGHSEDLEVILLHTRVVPSRSVEKGEIDIGFGHECHADMGLLLGQLTSSLVGVDILALGLRLRSLTAWLDRSLLLLDLLRWRYTRLAEFLQEAGERLRREQHASEISETVILLTQLLVLGAKSRILIGFGLDIPLKLTNVFCINVSNGSKLFATVTYPFCEIGKHEQIPCCGVDGVPCWRVSCLPRWRGDAHPRPCLPHPCENGA